VNHWAGVISAETFATERLYARDTIRLPAGGDGTRPAAGDHVVLLARAEDDSLVAFGVGRVAGPVNGGSGDVAVNYTYRLFDDPVPVDLNRPLGLTPLTRDEADCVSPREPVQAREQWFVSVAIPIEASSRAEAVREFWTYIDQLGPRELPAYVWPLGDELAMQAFVLGTAANQDPEEDD
jgi:hypothetical protein